MLLSNHYLHKDLISPLCSRGRPFDIELDKGKRCTRWCCVYHSRCDLVAPSAAHGLNYAPAIIKHVSDVGIALFSLVCLVTSHTFAVLMDIKGDRDIFLSDPQEET